MDLDDTTVHHVFAVLMEQACYQYHNKTQNITKGAVQLCVTASASELQQD